VSADPFWIGLASIIAGVAVLHRLAYRWWAVVLVFLALCFISVLLKGL
jgi:hypothetical protein